MPTYELTNYPNGAAVESALDKASTSLQAEERRFEAAAPYCYLGSASSGAAESESVWFITRLDFTAGMSQSIATSVAWADRATATYI